MNNKEYLRRIKHINDIKVRTIDNQLLDEEGYFYSTRLETIIKDLEEKLVIHIEKKEESLFDWYLRKCKDISILDELFN